MELSEQDRIEISDLINLHGHLTDAGDLDRASELFTPDVTYDLDDFGVGSLHGTAVMREAALALGNANPVGHHVTNIVITRIDDHSAGVRSKGIGVMADGTAGSVAYDDLVTRQPDGWKISYRKVTARRAALGQQEAGARDVLELCARQPSGSPPTTCAVCTQPTRCMSFRSRAPACRPGSRAGTRS
jgi:SnoaL-like domain